MPPRSPKAKAEVAPYPPGWEPFLGAIRDHLDEDTPRVVFADWLQENGDEARAEFIRLQCDIARGAPADAERAKALLAANRKRWLRGLPKSFADNPARCTFRRGFPALITVKGYRFESDGETIRRLIPLEELTLDGVTPELMAVKALAGVRTLIIPGANSAVVEALAESPVIPLLVGLNLSPTWGARISQRSVRKLLANPKLTNLRRLSLRNMPVGNTVAASLAAPHLAGLEELHLERCDFDADGARLIAGSPAAASLRVLGLPQNNVGISGLDHLVRSPHLRGLVELNLRWCRIMPASATVAKLLADWEGLRTIRTLDLRGSGFRETDAKTIKDSPFGTSLTELRVS